VPIRIKNFVVSHILLLSLMFGFIERTPAAPPACSFATLKLGGDSALNPLSNDSESEQCQEARLR
jgi:hypothetical protein